jgi:hypothetical protein
VDAAEIAALLERILESPGPERATDTRAWVADAILRSDALAEASRLHAALPPDHLAVREAVPLLLRLAGGDPPPPLDPEAARAIEPPPLRSGEWTEAAPPPEPGLLPSPHDPRWTLAFVSPGWPDEDRSRAVLVRYRAALDREGAPILLPIASEAWELGGSGGCAGASAWRFDRAEWLAGREPWRHLPQGAEVTVRDAADPSRLVTGPAASFAVRRCGGLRPAAAGARGAGREAGAVARALRGVLALRGAGP